jgi:ankyrin repeat protein
MKYLPHLLPLCVIYSYVNAMDTNPQSIQELLANTNSVAELDNERQSALFSYLNEFEEDDAVPAIHSLVARGININCLDNGGATPLHIYAHFAKPKLVEALLQYGARTDISTILNGTALHWTCYAASRIKLLGAKYATNDIDHIAILLITVGKANVHARNGLQETPLHVAGIYSDNIRTTLLAHGAEINAQDRDGNTVLHKALGTNYLSIAKELIHQGANYTIKNHQGKFPIDLIQERTDKTKFIAWIQALGKQSQ